MSDPTTPERSDAPTLHVYVMLDGHPELSEIGNGPVRTGEGELVAMLDMVAVLRQVADDVLRQHTEEAVRADAEEARHDR